MTQNEALAILKTGANHVLMSGEEKFLITISSKESMDEKAPKGSDVVPTQESGKPAEFTAEQIETARLEMEAELLERKKVEMISGAALESYNKTVDEMVGTLSRRLGRDAESVNIWESMRTQLANAARSEMLKMIGAIKGGENKNPMLAALAETINQDVFEGPQKGMKIPEAIDRNPEAGLVGLIKERGAELAGEELADVERALKLVSLNAQHKFFSWQHSGQLEASIGAQEELTRLNDDFDPARAGFFELRGVVENAAASIKLDLRSKPNYLYANPEYPVRGADLGRMLAGLSKVEARVFLRTHDVKLGEASD